LKQRFAETGSASAVSEDRILRSIEYTPTTIVRTFESSDFTVHETLFVPRELAGAVISYEIHSTHPVGVQLSFVPRLDRMWPVGFGGQEISCKPDENAYEIHEPTGRFHAVFGGPDIVAHDNLVSGHNAVLDHRGNERHFAPPYPNRPHARGLSHSSSPRRRLGRVAASPFDAAQNTMR
jgi:hypothetical protein